MKPGGSMSHSQGLSSNSYPETNQPNPSYWLIPISLGSILILSSHLRLGLPNDLFPVGLPINILKALLPSSIITKWLANLNLLDLTILNILRKRYKIWSSSLWSLLHSPFSSLLCSNICLRFLLRNALSPYSSLDVLKHVQQKIIVSFLLSVGMFPNIE